LGIREYFNIHCKGPSFHFDVISINSRSVTRNNVFLKCYLCRLPEENFLTPGYHDTPSDGRTAPAATNFAAT
jgi:hypothetical protein